MSSDNTTTDPTSGQNAAAMVTVRARLTTAGLALDRIEAHFAAARLLLDGDPVTDLDQPAPVPARLVISGA